MAWVSLTHLMCVVLQAGCHMDLPRAADWDQHLHAVTHPRVQIRQLLRDLQGNAPSHVAVGFVFDVQMLPDWVGCCSCYQQAGMGTKIVIMLWFLQCTCSAATTRGS